MIWPLLEHLKQDPMKNYIFWPRRTEKIDEFMKKIEEYLEIEPFQYDLNNLKPMKEKDELHGFRGLHDIRPIVKKTSLPPEQIIGKELTQYYNDMKLDFWHK